MHIPRQQRLEVFHGTCLRQFPEHFAQPGVGLEPVGLDGLDQRVDQRAGMGAGLRVAELPRFPADDEGTDGVFGRVIIDRQIAALGVRACSKSLEL